MVVELPDDIFDSLKQMAWIVSRVALDWRILVDVTFNKIDEQTAEEEDYIYSEVKDEIERIKVNNEKPEEAHIEIYGVTVKKKILHRKSEKYNGADLLLEIEDYKFALIQFKKVNSKGRYRFDLEQLKNLSKFCEFCTNQTHVPPQCPVYMLLIDDMPRFPVFRVHRVCEIIGILNGRASAHKTEFYTNGVTRRTFKEAFVKCWAGAYRTYKPKDNQLLEYSKETERLIVDYFMSYKKKNGTHVGQ